MPNESPALLEWNEENLSRVIADLYKEAETDQALHAQLKASPFDVLSSRIAVPQKYVGGIFAREKNQKTMMLYMPPFGASRQTLATETSEAGSIPDYEIICTTETIW